VTVALLFLSKMIYALPRRSLWQTLYVENIPDELYDALRNRAQGPPGRSIAAEVLALLEEKYSYSTRAEITA